MSKRLFEEVLLDPEHMDEYIGVRVADSDGIKTGTIVASGKDSDEVHAQIRRDQHNSVVGTIYYFYKPTKVNDTREGWAIGGD